MSDFTSNRDMELVRKILFELEEKSPFIDFSCDEIEGYDLVTVVYHLEIMEDAGLVKFVKLHFDEGGAEARLTWEGHEFLEAVRDDKRWEKVKAEMSKGGGFVYEIAKSIAVDFLEEEINPNRIKALQSQLIKRWDNLNELEEQAANFAAATIPLELKNQIKIEKEAIAELGEKLKLLTG